MPFIAAGHVKKGNPATNRLTYIIGVPAHTVGARMYIAIVTGATGASLSAPLDWDTLYSNVNVNNGAVCSVFTKVATDTEPATVEASTTVKDKAVWICWTVTEDDGVDTQGTTATGTSNVATIPALIPNVPNTLAIGIVAADQAATPFTTPANWTKLDEHTFGGSASIAVYSRQRPLIHSGGDAVNVGMGASRPWAGLVFAIIPVEIVNEPIPLLATMVGASATPSVALSVDRPAAVAMQAESATPTIALPVDRLLSMTLTADSATPDVVILHTTEAFRFVAVMSAASDTPVVGLVVRRALPVALTAQSDTAALVLAVERHFAAALTAQSMTPVIFLSVGLAVVRGGINVLVPSAVARVTAPSIVVVES